MGVGPGQGVCEGLPESVELGDIVRSFPQRESSGVDKGALAVAGKTRAGGPGVAERGTICVASYIWHDLVPVLGLCSQNKLIFHCIHDFDKYQVILNLSLYLDIFPLFSLKSIAGMVLKHSDKVKKKS